MARSTRRAGSDTHRPMKLEHCHTVETRREPPQPHRSTTGRPVPRPARSAPAPSPDQSPRARAKSRFRQRPLHRSETGRGSGRTALLPTHDGHRHGNAVQPKGPYPVSNAPVRRARTNPDDRGWTTNRRVHPKNSPPGHRPDPAPKQRTSPICAAEDKHPALVVPAPTW